MSICSCIIGRYSKRFNIKICTFVKIFQDNADQDKRTEVLEAFIVDSLKHTDHELARSQLLHNTLTKLKKRQINMTSQEIMIIIINLIVGYVVVSIILKYKNNTDTSKRTSNWEHK